MNKPTLVASSMLALALLVSGCGAEDSAGPSPNGPTEDELKASARCHTSDLSARVYESDAATGQRYGYIVLTNITDRQCNIYGYGGIQLVDYAGNTLPTEQERAAGPPTLVKLGPGQSAASQIQWRGIPAEDENNDQCQPAPAALLVIPPDETEQVAAVWDLGSVCQHGYITQNPYAAGTGIN